MPAIDTPAEKTVPTSIKLPASVKAQIDETARKAGMSAHAFMVKTLAETAQRAQLREQFEADSLDALQTMKETGMGYDFDDARAFFKAQALYRQGKAPKPVRPAMVRVG